MLARREADLSPTSCFDMVSIVAVIRLLRLLCIQKLPYSNFCPKTSYPEVFHGFQYVQAYSGISGDLKIDQDRFFLQLVEALCRFQSRMRWILSIYLILPAALGLWGRLRLLTKISIRNLPGEVKSGRGVGLTTLPPSVSRMSENVGVSTSHDPKGLHGLYRDNLIDKSFLSDAV
jgi:hypothetical protein